MLSIPVRWTKASRRRPRLLASPEELAALRKRLDGSVESRMLKRLRKYSHGEAPYPVTSRPRRELNARDRSSSYMLPFPAFLFALTGERDALKKAKGHALALAENFDRDAFDVMGYAHALSSVSWSYDLLYDEWKASEAEMIRDFVKRCASAQFAYVGVPLSYWATTILHNITQLCWTGLGQAGMCFHDEIDEAPEWARAAQQFYRAVAWLRPEDGSNIEGPSYGSYNNEQRIAHYEAARRCLGEDLYTEGDRQVGRWYLHMRLPGYRYRRNAFPWSDNPPMFDHHGPVHTLLALARRFKDPITQGMALEFWRRQIGAGGYLGWTNLLFYDPSVPEEKPFDEPKSKHFPDLGLICARSAWEDERATAISFQCGPFQGHRARKLVNGDPGGSHRHADVASLILFSRGEFLLVDPGYEGIKRTDHHNTILVDGMGQLGEGLKWFNVNRVLHWEGNGHIAYFSNGDQSTVWSGEAAGMYVADAGLEKFTRQVAFLAPDLLIVRDDLRATEPRVFSLLWHAWSDFESIDEGKGEWGPRGYTRGAASMSILPLFPTSLSDCDESPRVSCRRRHCDGVRARNCTMGELRVDSPSVQECSFVTVIGMGDAADGPPMLEATCRGNAVQVQRGPGAPCTVRFTRDGADVKRSD